MKENNSAILGTPKKAQPLVFARRQEGTFKLSEEVVAEMARYVQDDRQAPEAGGVVLGRHILGTEDIVADLATVPTKNDRRNRHGFARAREKHQAVIDDTWRASKKTCTYLGEWHTHPEHVPFPSGVDLHDWRRKLREDQFYGGGLFFVIVGLHATVAWEGFERDGSCERLHVKPSPCEAEGERGEP